MQAGHPSGLGAERIWFRRALFLIGAAALLSLAACANQSAISLEGKPVSEELLRKFKEIATLQRIDVLRPADRATDFAQGALAARGLGMRRLAERLEKLATA